MEYAEVKEYLDGIVRDYRNAMEQRCLTNHIRVAIAIDKDILMHEGLETVADIMGLEIREEKIAGSRFAYEYSFEYDGARFVSYEKKRLESFIKAETEIQNSGQY